jgi:hypothetical protein
LVFGGTIQYDILSKKSFVLSNKFDKEIRNATPAHKKPKLRPSAKPRKIPLKKARENPSLARKFKRENTRIPNQFLACSSRKKPDQVGEKKDRFNASIFRI